LIVVHRRKGIVDAQIVGTQKGGTTALFEFLSEHRQISTPRALKEVHFFDDEAMFAGRPNYGKYESLFGSDAHAIVRLEATPIYMYWAPVASRLAAYNPETKLIMILRDPVERAISQWEMEFSRGTETEAFESALEREGEHLGREEQHRVRSYIDRGFYGVQIRRLLRYFPREQMLLLKQDDLLAEHQKTLRRVYQFLGVDEPASFPLQRIIRPTEKSMLLPSIPADLRERLSRVFVSDLEDVERMTGLDVGDWTGHKSVDYSYSTISMELLEQAPRSEAGESSSLSDEIPL
jgi:Sulfotransferase domain